MAVPVVKGSLASSREWHECCLGEIASVKTGKLNACAAVQGGRYPFFTCSERPLSINDAAYDSESVLVAGNCTPYVNYYKGKFNAYQRTYIITPKSEKVSTRWLYFWMRHQIKFMITHQLGSVEKYFVLSDFTNRRINLPPLETQKRIAAILSSLDDKIENNKRINRHLEQMAQALFKSWFVDFTPFGGKMPKDWKRGTLKGIISTIETGARPRGGAVNEGIPSIGAENIEGLGIYNFENEKYIGIDFFRKLRRGKITDGDVLLYKDGAYTGKVSMALDGFPHRKAAVNEHVFLLRSREQKYQFYLYLLLKQRTFYKMLNTVASSKAAQPGLNQTDLLSIEIILPDESWLLNFERKISGIMHQMATSARESRILSQVRDSLLPRLMSGKIKIEKQRS